MGPTPEGPRIPQKRKLATRKAGLDPFEENSLAAGLTQKGGLKICQEDRRTNYEESIETQAVRRTTLYDSHKRLKPPLTYQIITTQITTENSRIK